MLYILLSGTPPFYDDDNFELFEQIKKCKYDQEEAFDNTSLSGDFIERQLLDGCACEVRLAIAKSLIKPPVHT